MSNILSTYNLVYCITVGKTIIFCEETSADKYFTFDKEIIPSTLKSSLFECKFILFNKEGTLEELVIETTNGELLPYTMNVSPLKMIHNLVARLRPNTQKLEDQEKEVPL